MFLAKQNKKNIQSDFYLISFQQESNQILEKRFPYEKEALLNLAYRLESSFCSMMRFDFRILIFLI